MKNIFKSLVVISTFVLIASQLFAKQPIYAEETLYAPPATTTPPADPGYAYGDGTVTSDGSIINDPKKPWFEEQRAIRHQIVDLRPNSYSIWRVDGYFVDDNDNGPVEGAIVSVTGGYVEKLAGGENQYKQVFTYCWIDDRGRIRDYANDIYTGGVGTDCKIEIPDTFRRADANPSRRPLYVEIRAIDFDDYLEAYEWIETL